MTEFDVLVVGMGPTGATLAALLAQRGSTVGVFDRLPGLYPLPRAAGVDHEALRIMQELGLSDLLKPHIAAYRPSEYRGVDGQLIKRLDAAPPPHRLGWAPNHVFEQPAFEGILRQRLAELPGVRAECNANVIAVGQGANEAWADVVLAGDARPTRMQARYIVACDGGGSPVRKSLGIGLEDLGFDEPWLVVDAIVSDAKLQELPQTQVQYCEPQRPSTFVVGVGNHRRWELMLQPGESLAGDYPEEELWPLLSRWIQPHEGRIWRAAAYRFHALVAQQWRRDRILLAGDAAHMTPPFMAQGMVQGLRDAANLAWKLERILRFGAPDALLDSYEVERRPHVVATTRIAMELGKVICERDPARARERDRLLLEQAGGAVRTQLRQDLIPGLQAGLLAPTAGAGAILPQPLVRADTGEDRLLDDVTGRGFRAVVAGGLERGERDALRAALAPLGGVVVEINGGGRSEEGVVAVSDPQDLVGHWLYSLPARIAIVRPDHYVHGTAGDAAAAVGLLRALRDAASRHNEGVATPTPAMTPALNLGDAALDEDHARLQELIAQLLQAPADGVVPALDALRAHAGQHFAVEDLDLRAMQDGNTQCHLDEHAAVLKSLDEVREVLLQDGLDAEAKALLVRRLASQLRDWLPEHVHGMDAGVATHRTRQRFGGSPVKIARRAAS